MSLNSGYAMIKFNSTQEELAIAYKSKRPVLFYDENQRAHWAVIEETATQSLDEETQEPITTYEYSYRLIDEANDVVANPTLSGDEATLNGLEVDGVKYAVGGSGGVSSLYRHTINESNNWVSITIILKTNTSFTKTTLAQWLYNNGYDSMYNRYTASNNSSTAGTICSGIYSSNGTSIEILTSDGRKNYEGTNLIDIISEV